MAYKKLDHIKNFQTTLFLLLSFMILLGGANSCGCGNPNQSRPKPTIEGGLAMEVTPTALQGDQRRITVTFIPENRGSSNRPLSLAPYQLQVSFTGNAQLYYTSTRHIDQVWQNQERIKLENLLTTQQINTPQAITLMVVPDLTLSSLEVEFILLDADNQVVQKSLVGWKQDKILSAIRIELGHNQANSKLIYALDNAGEDTLKGLKWRYTNISTDEEGKKVSLDGQLSNTLPIPVLVGGTRTDNRFLAIDFKDAAQRARFRFEVIDSQEKVLAIQEEVFNKNPSGLPANNREFQAIVEELKDDSKDIDMNKIKRLFAEPGIPINQLETYENSTYIYPITLVSKAAQRGNLEMVKLLIAKGANVEARAPGGASALEMAAQLGDQAMVKALLEAGADVNGSPTNAFAPIHLAARYGNVAMLRELLKSDQLDINKKDGSKRIGLHFLIGAMGKPVIQDSKEKKQEILEIIKEMINRGADVNQQTIFGSTPLHWATRDYYASEALELILNAPTIQVDAQDDEGYTPLHTLVHDYLSEKDPVLLNDLSQRISKLIQKGARIDLKSKPWNERPKVHYGDKEWKRIVKEQAGKSVLELAVEAGNADLIRLLGRG